MGVSGSELKALKVVQEEGGETSTQVVSRKMGIDTNYARLLCTSLARADYLDYLASGKFKITVKGKSVSERTSPPEANQEKNKGVIKNQVPTEWVLKSSRREGERKLDWNPYQIKQKEYQTKQEEGGWIWHSVKMGKPYGRGGTRRTGQILTDEIYACGFCKGEGEKPKGAKCSVCRGKGEVSLEPPAVACAYCKGRGEERPRSNVTCTVCRGKGVVSIQEPIEVCSHCRGIGAEPTNKLPCIVCRGKGVVTIKPKLEEPEHFVPYASTKITTESKQKKVAEERRAKPGSVTGSELEVLQVFKEAEENEKPLNVSDYTGMSPGYVSILISCLVKKGFLAPTGSRQYQLTKEAKELLKKKGASSESKEVSETLEDKSGEVQMKEDSPVEMGKDEGLEWRPLDFRS